MTLKRKITAIMAADIAQYSRLISEDEEETLMRLGSYRQVFDDFVARSGGRIFNTAGDAVMCEFPSAVEATRCAIDIQESLRTRNMAYPPSRQMHFRIGITIGDVVEREGDLLGDGVNIAARLEGLADPGGICISRNVHEAVSSKLSVPFRDLGEREVKNIPHPVHAFTVDLGGGKPGTAPPVLKPPSVQPPRSGLSPAVLIGIGVLVAAVGTGAVYVLHEAGAPKPVLVVGPVKPAAPVDAPVKPGQSVVVTENLSPAEAFARLAQSGGLVKEPKSAPEYYHNARSFEARGEGAQARRDYLALAGLKTDHVDPHLRFGALLRAQDGRAGARETYAQVAASGGRANALGQALQFDGAERRSRLLAFAAEHPDFAPVHYLIAEEFGEDRQNSQTIADKRAERAALQAFLDAEKAGKLVPFFLDQSVLAAWIDRAAKRQVVLAGYLDSARAKAGLTFMRAGSGWMATITAPEAAVAMAYRIGEPGDFKPTGLLQMVDQRTGKQMANPMFEMPANQKGGPIAIRYTDANGIDSEPVTVAFDPDAALLRGQREMLERTSTSWIAFGTGSNQNLIYYTHLISFRCAIKAAEIGYNGGDPIVALPVPPCDPANPSAIPANALPFLRLTIPVKSVSVRLTWADGTQSEIKTFEK